MYLPIVKDFSHSHMFICRADAGFSKGVVVHGKVRQANIVCAGG